MAKLQDKVHGLYNAIKEAFYLCSDDLIVGAREYNSALLFGILTELNRGNQLIFGEYGGGKTTSAEYLHAVFNCTPLDLVRRVVIRADPQKTDEKLIARPHYGKLFGQEESVVWQHFVLLGPKIIDEFNRLPEPNQSILLNGVDRGDWQYLNEFVSTCAQPFFATCNYEDEGNNALIPPLLDRFDVAVESKYCGVAGEDLISEDFHNEKDDILKDSKLTVEALHILNSDDSYDEIQDKLEKIFKKTHSKLSAAGFSVLDNEEKLQIQKDIKSLDFDQNAHMYFLFLASELSVSEKFGDKRSIDPIENSNGLYLHAVFNCTPLDLA